MVSTKLISNTEQLIDKYDSLTYDYTVAAYAISRGYVREHDISAHYRLLDRLDAEMSEITRKLDSNLMQYPLYQRIPISEQVGLNVWERE